jgi:hypothetical protein
MQEYGRVIAEEYSKRWIQFSAFMGPLLDHCCGIGQLCNFFLQYGYSVVGVDCSSSQFIQADVTGYEAGQEFGLIVCLYDSLNHLDSLPQLAKCFLQARLPTKGEGKNVWLDAQSNETRVIFRFGIKEVKNCP